MLTMSLSLHYALPIYSDTNIVKFLFPDGEVRELEQMTKAEVAEELLNTVLRLRKS